MIDIQISDDDIDLLIREHNALIVDAKHYWNFDDQRRHVLKTWDDVQACPGSGKTTLVAAKLIILAKKWNVPHSGISVLTHTNVAKNEIVSRLQNHPAGFKLTSYPHFIGTIQEFINRFISIPYARAENWSLIQLEDNDFASIFYRVRWRKFRDLSSNKDYFFSYYIKSSKIKFEDFFFVEENHTLAVNPKFLASVQAKVVFTKGVDDAYLLQKKREYCNLGFSQYKDAYAFAKVLLHENPDIISALRKRFPIVFIDEMQDTQKFQDDLINEIFADPSVRMQRLGDPDQSIYDGIGSEESNESYNQAINLYQVSTSHRFGSDICEKIIGLSYNRLSQLSSDRNPIRDRYKHTVFVFNHNTRNKVLDAFGELIAESDPDKKWKTVKALGGVDGTSGHIKQYWEGYDKNKSPTSQKIQKLVHAVFKIHAHYNGHASGGYELLVQGVVDLLRNQNLKITNSAGREVYYTKQSLLSDLKARQIYIPFRKLITSLGYHQITDATTWNCQVSALKTLLSIEIFTEEARSFTEFDTSYVVTDEPISSGNIYTCLNGRQIAVGTIHSAKGETHDATLVLETKHRTEDIKEMLPFIIDPSLQQPPQENKKKFMHRLYVACSRPRHLLCLSIHSDHIQPDQISSLKALGWNVKHLEELADV